MSNNPDDFLARAQEGIGARFQSQASIEKANEQREKDWKEAYAKLGQEPPKPVDNFVHDGRTLAERLELNRQLNEEEWDHKMKLGNQYRGLDAEETSFLNARRREQEERERGIREAEQRELQEYRQALAAKRAVLDDEVEAAASAIPSASSSRAPGVTAAATSSSAAPRKPVLPPKAAKRDVKSLMKGVVVKKKPTAAAGATKPTSASANASGSTSASASGSGTDTAVGAGTRAAGTDSAGGAGSAGLSGTGSPALGPPGSGGGSGTATPRSSMATEGEMRNSAQVGAAGVTALGKRLVQGDDSDEDAEEEEAEPEAAKRQRTAA